MLMKYVLDQYAYDFTASLCFEPSEFRKLSNDTGDRLMKRLHKVAGGWRGKVGLGQKVPTNPAGFQGRAYHSHLPDEVCYLYKN